MKISIAVLILILSGALALPLWAEESELVPSGPAKLIAARDGEIGRKSQYSFIKRSLHVTFKRGFWITVLAVDAFGGGALFAAMTPCQGLADCPRMIETCEPLIIRKQNKRKTVLSAGPWKAVIKDDLREQTFTDRLNCENAAGLEPTGVVGIVPNEQLRIVTVVPGSPADEAGIRPGYRIMKISGEDVTSTLMFSDLALGLPGTEVEIMLMRNRVKTSYKMLRKPWSEVYK